MFTNDYVRSQTAATFAVVIFLVDYLNNNYTLNGKIRLFIDVV